MSNKQIVFITLSFLIGILAIFYMVAYVPIQNDHVERMFCMKLGGSYESGGCKLGNEENVKAQSK